MKQNLLRMTAALAIMGAAACADSTPVTPTLTAKAPSFTKATSADNSSGEVAVVSPYLAQLNADLEASGADYRIAKAELLMDGKRWDGVSSTLLIANDRFRGIGAEWVPGDPRRAGRIGVNYAIAPTFVQLPITRDPDFSNRHEVPYEQLVNQIGEAMSAWRGQSCPVGITPVAFVGRPDIQYLGWYPKTVFESFTANPADGDNIIGVTFSAVFVNPDHSLTDIDHNGKADLARAQILFNDNFAWGNNGAFNVVDFYSIITHESGHALGLGHFGKVFVNRNNIGADGSISLDDIKYAPKAMMNAVYVTGRSEIAGTDHSSFCQIWSSAQ